MTAHPQERLQHELHTMATELGKANERIQVLKRP
jgi:hypothetical protein